MLTNREIFTETFPTWANLLPSETPKQFVFGNWKMNKTLAEAQAFFKNFVSCERLSNPKIVTGIIPPFTILSACRQILKNSPFLLGAQTVHEADSGAFTGEISAPMLKDIGVDFVLIGHSERRHIFHEQNEALAKKLLASIRNHIVPVLCIGETLEEQESGATQDILLEQLTVGLSLLPEKAPFILAYEPVWAIGTGKVANPDLVQETHAFCRNAVKNLVSKDTADRTPILYGGSVKADNAHALTLCPDVNGLLVGGASLSPESFLAIIQQVAIS